MTEISVEPQHSSGFPLISRGILGEGRVEEEISVLFSV